MHKANSGIETGPMNLPKMDRPSVALAWFMDSIQMEEMNRPINSLMMTCTLCQEHICAVEDGDTLRVLFNTALAHTC